jgi:hypothetical protein
MIEVGRKGLFAFAATMALILAALTYFLFAAHASKEQPASSAARSPAPAALEMPRMPAVAPPSPIAPDEVDLCGYGPVKQDAVEDIHAKARTAADIAFNRLKEKLAASQDERESALGLYLQRSAYLEGSQERLIKLASGSRDPQVYALAFLSCGYVGDGCGSLPAEQWAAIDPGNGVPWLLIAGSARNDATRYEAIYRASTSQRFDARFPNFFALLHTPDVQRLEPQARAAIVDDLVGLQTTLPTLLYTPFIKYCRGASVADPNRTSICTNLANLLLDDRTLVGFSAGVTLAESAGWPSNKISALREEKTEYQRAAILFSSGHSDKVQSDCDELAEFENRLSDYANLGDRGWQ